MKKLKIIWKNLSLYKKLGLIGLILGIIGYIPQVWFLNYIGFFVTNAIGQYICQGFDFFTKCLFVGYIFSPLINMVVGALIGFLISKIKK